MAKKDAGGDDEAPDKELELARYRYLTRTAFFEAVYKGFAVLFICLMIGSCCVAYEYRLAKEAEFKAKESKW